MHYFFTELPEDTGCGKWIKFRKDMKRFNLLFLSLLLLLFYSCDRRKITRTDTETSGFAVIGADECFAPIINEELYVFTGLNPEAVIQPIYTGENELYDLFLNDSIRLIITARDITESERASFIDMKLTPRSQRIAKDGIALIVNKENPDSLINTALLKKIMTGGIDSWNEISNVNNSKLGKIEVVFDNPNSSTLRFIHETITQGESLSPELRALDSNPAVIDFVAKTPNALGIIGVNWISNPNDSTKLSFDETIRVMSVGIEEEITVDNTYKPYPVFLNNESYPLIRDVYLILTDLRETLPAGFVKFVAGDAGQRIILKAGLVPGTRPSREIYLKDDF